MDPYAPGLAQLRAAQGTSDFESEWKANRLRELEAEHRRIEQAFTARPTARLTVAELDAYRAPDIYNLKGRR